VTAVPLLPGLLPGPSGNFGTAPEEQIAELLARPASLHTVHRPVVSLNDGRCIGFESTVRIADSSEGGLPSPQFGSTPSFRAAGRTGLSGQLGAAALTAALRERATMPGERFLIVPLDADALGHPDVVAVLSDEDDVADLTLTLLCADLAPGHRAGPVLDELRSRGLQLAVTAGTAGLTDLQMVERLHPDLITLPAGLVRDVHEHRVRQRLVDVVVELAEETGATTLAEEVESLDETQVLRALGVRMAQGWLFGRARVGFPPPPAEVCEWLRLHSA
jgi:EAL domain-containing protein (putative c-di-GMP-specific phosphodiesterase class I)